MARHMLHSLSKSDSFGMLSLKAKVLWPMLIADVDDQGRFKANPRIIKWTFCPNVDEITIEDIPVLLEELVSQSMILVYKASNRHYGQILNWWNYQSPRYARPSDYPAPEGWQDRINVRVKDGVDGWLKIGWDTPGGFLVDTVLSDSTIEQNSKPVLGDKNKNKNKNKTTTAGSPPFSQIFTEGTGVLVATAAQAQEIDAWMEDVSEDWFRAACKEAADNNARKWSYVRAILERWKAEGRQKRGKSKRGSEQVKYPEYAETRKRRAARRRREAGDQAG